MPFERDMSGCSVRPEWLADDLVTIRDARAELRMLIESERAVVPLGPDNEEPSFSQERQTSAQQMRSVVNE